MASTARFEVVAIGNAIVDVIARADDALIEAEGLTKGSMRLIDAEEAGRLYAAMGPAIEMSGGSAANTLAGMAALGRRCAFIGQVADDQLGADADILYLEGYLWDPPLSRAAMRRAIDVARGAGRKVAFTLSDAFIIDRHGDDFRALIGEGLFDILFANEVEICALAGTQDFEAAVAAIAPRVPLLVVTRSEKGAIAVANGERVAVGAEPIDTVVDTTGAGDLFAAGFLAGQAEGRSLADCLTMGAVCAREIIAQVGPRAQSDLKAEVAARLG